MLMFQLDYLETTDGIAVTDFVSTSTRSSPASDSNFSSGDNGLPSLTETAELLDAGEVDSAAHCSTDDFLDDFFPHLLHEPHVPVPIAMVNRGPTGSEPFVPQLMSCTS
jgi:hypothetical protein